MVKKTVDAQEKTNLHLSDDSKIILERCEKLIKRIDQSGYLHGTYLHRILANTKTSFRSRSADIISSCKFTPEIKQETLSVFDNPNITFENSQTFAFYFNDLHVVWRFIDEFNPLQVNTLWGVSIDQVFLNLKTYSLHDPSNYGVSDISADPVILRTTSETDEYNEDIGINLLLKLSCFERAKIHENDLEKFKSIKKCPDLFTLLWHPYPYNAIKTILEYENLTLILFNSLLRLAAYWGVSVSENITPEKVFSTKNIKLLETYCDYFYDKTFTDETREKTLLKIALGDN